MNESAARRTDLYVLGDGSYELIYCPLHAAATDMLAALRAIYDCGSIRYAEQVAWTAIAAATKDAPQ